MAYAGKMNKLFVERLQQLGSCRRLSGVDGRSMEGERKAAIKVIEAANASSCATTVPAVNRSIPVCCCCC